MCRLLRQFSTSKFFSTFHSASQEELGEKAELNYKFIGQLERGQVNVSLDSLVRIAGALEVKIGDLFSEEKISVQKIVIKEKSPLSKFSSQDLRLIEKALRLLIEHFQKYSF
jgi:transcriptional regulator with XRE-family HTH domain